MMTLRTPHGDTYRIDSNGNIARTDIATGKPSGKWIMLGLVNASGRAFGTGFIPRERITPEWLASHPLRFKNGNPRYTVRDLDHGTTRAWGNTRYHGIASILLD